MMMPMTTTAAMRIHSHSSDEVVEAAGDGATLGAAVVGAAVVGGTVVGASVVGWAVGPVVGEPPPVGRVGRVTLGAALLIALLMLLAAPLPKGPRFSSGAACPVLSACSRYGN
jgi:hypothetical protein